jgi:uncharacterized protein involved in response to NO
MSMPAALARRRDYAGPALFSYGFRPFFLAAGLWAVIGLPLWLHQYSGDIALPTRFTALDWHIHEMLYGYVAAAMAGFLLTAIPNWTGRLPVNGWPLAALAALWLAGRVAIFFSAVIGGVTAAVIDIAFLAALAAVAAREIVAGQNWRNLRVLTLLGVLIAANIVFHAEVLLTGATDYGVRLGIGAVILLISLIGGRIVPSFTGNWLARNNPGRRPLPFSRFDMVTIAASALALVAWIAAPEYPASGALLVLAGLMQAVRLARWAGDRAVADRLVLVLHVAYLFVPVGFVLLGASTFFIAVPRSAGIHAWTAGAIGLMTLAVMTRASLGHIGRPLEAGFGTQAIYGLVLAAAVLRIAAAFTGSMWPASPGSSALRCSSRAPGRCWPRASRRGQARPTQSAASPARAARGGSSRTARSPL